MRQAGATLHRGAGTTLHRGARASHYRGPSRCGAQAPDAQAQQLWLTGPAAPRHVGSSQTRARTRVSRTSRQTLNHCATREAPLFFLILNFMCDTTSKSWVLHSTFYIENRFFSPEVCLYKRRVCSVFKGIINALLRFLCDGYTSICFIIPYIFHLSTV